MSAPKQRPTSVVGAVLGFVGFSALAGLLVTIGVTPALAVGSVTASSSVGIFNSLPDYISIGQLQQRNTLYATAGGKQVAFATLYDQNRVNDTWDNVSDNLKKAAVDGEDRRFYEHGGVDLTSIIRAGIGSVTGGLGAAGGGSTLTMQLVKNIRLAQAQNAPTIAEQKALSAEATDTSITRKLQEMKLAIGLEKKYTKNEILLAYLNIAYFGDQAYGVEAAAQHYYDKSAKDLTPIEAASLIAIVQFPTSRNLSTPKNYAANEGRRNVILKSMLQEGDIDQKYYDAALKISPAKYVKLTPPTQGCAAVTWPGAQNFCDYVQRNVGNFSFLGSTTKEREANWKTGGYKLYTTLNLDLTANAKSQIDSYAPNTETRFDLGGVVDSVQPGTGRVIVMAQNKNYTAGSGNSTQTSLNFSTDEAYGNSGGFQTGSTYKAFTLADWLAKGHGLNEYVDATPRTFSPFTQCGKKIVPSPPYSPKNDEGYIRGNMSVMTATALSVNVAFVAMAQDLDLCDIKTTAESLGVHPAKTGAQLEANPSSVLGTNYIAPLTMAAAYAGIANNGVYCSPILVDKAIDSTGKDLGGQPKSCKRAMSADVAHGVVYALKGTLTGGGTAVGADPGNGGQYFAKTGTTDAADQIWLIGSNTALTTVTWMGNIEGKTSLRQEYGPHGQYASSRASLFNAIATVNDTLYKGGDFTDPPQDEIYGTTGVTVPDVTGMSTTDAENALIAAGLGYTIGSPVASSQPQGDIATTSPAAGVSVAQGTRVQINPSDGSQATTSVPTVTGQTLKDAESALSSAGFDTSKVTVTYAQSDDSQKCDVQSSTPAGGSQAAADTAIQLTVGGGTAGTDPGNCT
ncbi:transglycosylase domain-containing protein [Frondihabitans australicus]|uniref:Membrane peptidoglycan carboxypeptidase n=1 Tax=Frondihabitans australicus TaxID=386892 RepID=A0A495IBW4_9MICO|nr:transglycosylase domain-containing protein [Frondihabitans australicus]RKR73150.1 membrane peptidoglycan carboxypeptidase [Frondihabitans australicus]